MKMDLSRWFFVEGDLRFRFSLGTFKKERSEHRLIRGLIVIETCLASCGAFQTSPFDLALRTSCLQHLLFNSAQG